MTKYIPGTTMTVERFRRLEFGPPGQKLTRAEQREGWHFCVEFDEGLTTGEQLDDEGRCAWCGFDKRKVP